MKNKEKKYDLNLDLLVPFFLLGKEEIKNRVWFKGHEKKYENELKNLKIGWCGINIPLEGEKNDDDENWKK